MCPNNEYVASSDWPPNKYPNPLTSTYRRWGEIEKVEHSLTNRYEIDPWEMIRAPPLADCPVPFYVWHQMVECGRSKKTWRRTVEKEMKTCSLTLNIITKACRHTAVELSCESRVCLLHEEKWRSENMLQRSLLGAPLTRCLISTTSGKSRVSVCSTWKVQIANVVYRAIVEDTMSTRCGGFFQGIPTHLQSMFESSHFNLHDQQ